MDPRFGQPGMYGQRTTSTYYPPPYNRVQDLPPSMNPQLLSHLPVACPPYVSSASSIQPVMHVDMPRSSVMLHPRNMLQPAASTSTPGPKVVVPATNLVPQSSVLLPLDHIQPSVTLPRFISPSPVQPSSTADIPAGMQYPGRGWMQFTRNDVIVPNFGWPLPVPQPIPAVQHVSLIPRAQSMSHSNFSGLESVTCSHRGNIPVRLPLSSQPSVATHLPVAHMRPGAGNIIPIPMETGPPGRVMHFSAGSLPMETDASQVKEQPLSILDITLEQNQQSRTLREHFSTFVKEHYPFLGKKIYIVPEKPPISQKQPDKLLVRAREGQYRVTMAIERVAHYKREALFLLSDYKHESFFKFFSLRIVKTCDQPRIKERFNQFISSKQFGDSDIIIFHKQHSVLVLSICSVSSNSDVQYILKRLQKYRQQLNKSYEMMDKTLHFLGLHHCSVIPILVTPNLKRSFLAKVTPRDKGLHKLMCTMSTLCSDELPAEFRNEWTSEEHFQTLVGWWEKVNAETQNRGPNQEELEVLVGSFLCPDLSDAGFDQTKEMQPSEEKKLCFESDKQTIISKAEASTKTVVDLLSMSLSIGNVTKSFKQCMEEYVDQYFPKFMEETYRVPPVHFNIQKFDYPADNNPYIILNMPMSKDTRGDEGESRVISAIEILGLKSDVVCPVFIICDFQYNNYLNKLKESMFEKGDERRPQRAFGQSVRAQHDCLLIHRRYGIIIISVKAVGDNFHEWANSGSERWTAVKRTLGKVLKQLPREEKMVGLVLSDLTDKVPCHKLVALPNLSRQDINAAISDDTELKKCIQGMFPEVGTGAFLCQDELCESNQSMWEALEEKPELLDKLNDWWVRSLGYGQENLLSENLCKQIIGRFCGLLSTVEVWTAQTPRVEVRSIAEAIQETAERFTCVLLTPEQVSILNLESRLVFLSGPPGSGKTLILRLKAEQWAKAGNNLIIININHGSKGLPLGHLMEQQLKKSLEKDHEFSSHHLKNSLPQDFNLNMQNSAGMDSLEGMKDNVSSYLGSPGRTSSSSSFVHSGNVSELVIHRIDLDSSSPHTLEKLLEIPSGSYLVIDEIRQTSWNIISWLLKHCNPKSLWCAGQYGEDPPPTFEKHLLKQIIRCPPMVQRVLKRAEPELGNVKTEWFETSAPHGLPTDGSRPWIIFHSKHETPVKVPLDCTHCGQELADIFSQTLKLVPPLMQDYTRQRKSGPAPFLGIAPPLMWKDVVIVCRDVDDNCGFLKGLRSRGILCTVITDTSNPHVALPEKDEIIFTTPFAMTGLERRVVVFLPFEAKDILMTDSDKDVEEIPRTVKGFQDDLKLGQAISELTAENKVCLWYTASRCMGQLIIFIP